MSKPRIPNFRKAIPPFALLSNNVLAQTMNEKNYRQTAATFLSLEPTGTFEHRLKKLLENRRFRELITANATTIEQFCPKAFLVTNLSTDRIWQLYRYILK